MLGKMKVWSGALAALCLVAATGPSASARPPDLPASVEQECRPESHTGSCPVGRPCGLSVQENLEKYAAEVFQLDSGEPVAGAPVPCALHQFCADLLQAIPFGFGTDPSACPVTRLLQTMWPTSNPVVWGVQIGEPPVAPTCYLNMMPPCGPMGVCPVAVPACTVAAMPVGYPMNPATCGSGRVNFGQPVLMAPGCPVRVDLPPTAAPVFNGPMETHEALEHLAISRQMYQMAEFYLRTGNLLAAHHCYQETHLHSPLSRYGQVALLKLTQIEQQVASTMAAPPMPKADEPSGTDSEQSSTPHRASTSNERYLQRLAQAQDMFHIAERCRSQGDFDKAYTCYHEARRLCPDSDYARLAAQQIRRIDVLRQVQEAQDATENTAGEQDANEPTAVDPGQRSARQRTEEPTDTELLPMYVPFLAELFGVSDNPVQEEFSDFDMTDMAATACPAPEEFSDFPATDDSAATRTTTDKPVRCGCRSMRGWSERNRRESCESRECQQERLARSIETSAWLFETLNVLGGGNTRVDLDVDNSTNSGLRVRGGIYFGVFGCQVICEGDNCRVVWPAVRGE